jgi:hypothetical protein
MYVKCILCETDKEFLYKIEINISLLTVITPEFIFLNAPHILLLYKVY